MTVTPVKVPPSAVGMMATEIFMSRVEKAGMNQRDLACEMYGPNSLRMKGHPTEPERRCTFAEGFAEEAARLAWTIARAVEATAPSD